MNNQPLSSNCQQAQEAILALLDQDDLNHPDRIEQQALIARHLPGCPACQAYQQSMQNLTLSLKNMEPVAVPDGLEQRILQSVALPDSPQEAIPSNQSEPERTAFGKRGQPVNKLAPIAATIVAIALALPLVYQALTPNRMNGLTSIVTGQKENLNSSATQIHSSTAINTMHTSSTLEEPLPDLPLLQPSRKVANIKPLAAEPISVQPAEVEPGQTDQTEVALSLPSAQTVDNTYANNHEGDIYFDPVSDLVDF